MVRDDLSGTSQTFFVTITEDEQMKMSVSRIMRVGACVAAAVCLMGCGMGDENNAEANSADGEGGDGTQEWTAEWIGDSSGMASGTYAVADFTGDNVTVVLSTDEAGFEEQTSATDIEITVENTPDDYEGIREGNAISVSFTSRREGMETCTSVANTGFTITNNTDAGISGTFRGRVECPDTAMLELSGTFDAAK